MLPHTYLTCTIQVLPVEQLQWLTLVLLPCLSLLIHPPGAAGGATILADPQRHRPRVHAGQAAADSWICGADAAFLGVLCQGTGSAHHLLNSQV